MKNETKSVPPISIEMARALYLDGLSLVAVGALLGVSGPAAGRYLRAVGCPIRRPGRPRKLRAEA